MVDVSLSTVQKSTVDRYFQTSNPKNVLNLSNIVLKLYHILNPLQR